MSRDRLKAGFAEVDVLPLVAELANGWHGYIPTEEAFGHGGYETCLAYASRLVPDAGDRMCEAALDALRALHRG